SVVSFAIIAIAEITYPVWASESLREKEIQSDMVKERGECDSGAMPNMSP
ncbi:hypothetical protein FIBSPDRAFT_861832, partial [Athelia psychrophila]